MPPDQNNSERDQTHTALISGTMVDHYRIVEEIGAGGMGVVFLADDIELKRQVALKFLPPHLCQDEDFRKRFRREAQAAARLSHPNIITVYEVSEYQGRPFMAMERVEGQTLAERISAGPMSVDEILHIIRQLCAGLGEAHGKGLVHRDIKPSNILIDEAGVVKVSDFGLAEVMTETGISESDIFMGTVSYTSPEILQNSDVTPAADLFSVGVVLYQMITGILPFTGEYEASVAYSIMNDAPDPLTASRPDISPGLEQIVNRLLQKNVGDRYCNVEELAADLEAVSTESGGQAAKMKRLGMGRRARLTILFIGLLIVFALIGWQQFGNDEHDMPGKKMLAVLPFENLGSPEDEYFADGMTDAITMHLTKYGGLGVISQTSSSRYKNSELSAHEIAEELGASYVLTGSIYWDRTGPANEVRIDARLSRVGKSSDLWAESYQRVINRIFEMQSEIAQSVTGALNIAIRNADRDALITIPTRNLTAYDFYLRGNQYFRRSWDREDINIATQMYERAVDHDPQFAEAWAMLSRGHESMYWEYFDRSEDRCKKAKVAAEKALDLDPGSVDGHLALGYYYYHCDQNHRLALDEFALVLGARPNNADLYSAIAPVQRRQGLLEQAVLNFQRALELDPSSNLKAFDVGLTFGLMRKYAEAESYLDTAILLAPDWPLPYVYKAWLSVFSDGDTDRAKAALAEASGRADLTRDTYYWWLARLLETDFQKVLDKTALGTDTVAYYLHLAQLNRLLGKHAIERAHADSARQILESRLRQAPNDARYHSRLGLAYAGLRRKTDAVRHAARAVELLPASQDAFDPLFFVMNLTEVLVIFGEYDAAVEQLNYLLSIPGFVSVPYLMLDPLWIPLHDHPGFRKMVASAKDVQN